MIGRKARIPWITPYRLIPITRSHSSNGSRHASPTPAIPALLQSTCAAPNRSIVNSASSFTAVSPAVSQTCVATSAPASVSRASTSRSFGASMSASTTRIPSAMNRSARARPMPEAPPVITATLPGAITDIGQI